LKNRRLWKADLHMWWGRSLVPAHVVGQVSIPAQWCEVILTTFVIELIC
jgi:hypothetical protein